MLTCKITARAEGMSEAGVMPRPYIVAPLHPNSERLPITDEEEGRPLASPQHYRSIVQHLALRLWSCLGKGWGNTPPLAATLPVYPTCQPDYLVRRGFVGASGAAGELGLLSCAPAPGALGSG